MKGVILAGGSGTRLHPLTRITNKHLLPLYDRPMVTYAVEALVGAGIEEVMLVTGGTHAGEFFRLLGNGHEHGIDRLFYAYQEQAGGIAEAFALAERFVARDKVCVLLADNVFEHSLRPMVENFARQAAGARVVLSHVEQDEHLRHLGVARMNGDRVEEIVEKPETPPSRYAVTGAYFYDAQVWEILPSLKLSGSVRVVVLDRTSGETFTEDIGDDNPVAIYVPGIHGHGYEALVDSLFTYLVTEEYDAAQPDEHGIPWDDERVRHLWSTSSPILSARDASS